eukprot:365978-Chlamydomonas_euryale.AAC.14
MPRIRVHAPRRGLQRDGDGRTADASADRASGRGCRLDLRLGCCLGCPLLTQSSVCGLERLAQEF